MVKLDTLVSGGRVVSSRGIQEMDIGIKDGKVYSLTTPGTQMETARTIEVKGRFVLPGCLDARVHTRDPGQTHKEDFGTLSRAAAAGGVTTIMCLPPTITPPFATLNLLMPVLEGWSKKSVVDFTVQPMVGPDNMGEIPGFVEAGAISMDILGPGATGPMLMEVMKVVHESGGLSSLSGGDGGYAELMKERLRQAGHKNLADWISIYPSIHEAVGVSRVLLLTEGTPYRVHFSMTTTRGAVDLIRRAKQAGRNTISAATSPKYLLLTEEDHLRMGPLSTMIPRFKTKDDNEAIWEGILDGTIDMIATDHAPHVREEKEVGLEDIWKAPTGVPEVELYLPLMLTQVNRDRLSLPRLVALMAEAPAKEYGIFPQKGVIQVGSDADLVIVDMDRKMSIDDAQLVTAPKYSAFHGYAVQGLPVMTMLRGEVVVEEGKFVDSPPRGSMVHFRR